MVKYHMPLSHTLSVFIDRFYLPSVNEEIYHTNQIDLSNSETSVDYIEKLFKTIFL